MIKRGMNDCKRGYQAKISNPAYLAGYGRQYETEQKLGGRHGN